MRSYRSLAIAVGLLVVAHGIAYAGTQPISVPEPASAALLAIGAGAVLWMRRRMKK